MFKLAHRPPSPRRRVGWGWRVILSESPLTPALSPWRGAVPPCPLRRRPLSLPYPLADTATLRCKLAKASLLGGGQGEGL
jgi:hypothetical protein